MVDRPLLNRDLLYLSTFFLLKNFGLPLTHDNILKIIKNKNIDNGEIRTLTPLRIID
jgi:hypothetical protein